MSKETEVLTQYTLSGLTQEIAILLSRALLVCSWSQFVQL